jgi:pilus assembly protein CpaB
MNTRTIIVIGLALVVGLSAAAGVSQMNRPAAAPQIEQVQIVTAMAAMPRGATVTAEMLTTMMWPKDRLPAGTLTKTEDAVGRTVVIPLLAGEPLLEQKVAKTAFGQGIAPLVAVGMRAFTVQTPTLTSGVAGLLLPGNKVDVLWTATSTGMQDKTEDASGGGTTVTLLQNIEILAADQQIAIADGKTNKELRSVTLQVTEAEAKKLSLAQQKGTINLALRNSGDAKRIDSPTVTLNDIRDIQEAIESPRPAAEQPVRKLSRPRQPVRVRIRTLHGRHTGEVQLELHGNAAVPVPPTKESAPPTITDPSVVDL